MSTKSGQVQVEDVATIISQLPQTALIEKQKPMYDRIFNRENIFGVLATDPNSFKEKDQTPLSGLIGESIIASSANNDSGLFDLNFHDERYLPFEGAGAISKWTLELPKNFRSFNYDTNSDVLLHISYTAYEGENRTQAETDLVALVNSFGTSPGFHRLVSLRHEFPDVFYNLLNQNGQSVQFGLTANHFPYLFSSQKLEMISGATIFLKPKKKMGIDSGLSSMTFNSNSIVWSTVNIQPIPFDAANPSIDEIKVGDVPLGSTPTDKNPVRTWEINTGNSVINNANTEDVLILIRYKTT